MYYHFLKAEHAIEDLQEERVRVSLINELNDPFELLPYLRYDPLEKRKPYYRVRRAVAEKYGLLCFSENWGDPLLWGHYANKHEGIALGFEILKDRVLDVVYVNERPKCKLTGHQEKDEKVFLDLARTKYKKWSYEEESRILVKLEDCVLNDGASFLPFLDRLIVREIILGARIDKGQLANMSALADNLGAEVIFARLNWGEYRIVKDGGKTAKFNK